MIKKPFTGTRNKRLALLGTSFLLSATLIAPSAMAATDTSPTEKETSDETVKVAAAGDVPDIDLPVRVVVNYVDENGNRLAPTLALRGDVGGRYDVNSRNFDGYRLISTAGDTFGFMESSILNVTYMYLKLEGSTTPNLPTDTTAPTAPNVADVAAGAKFVTGSAEAGSVVTVTFANKQTATTVAASNGTFSVTVPSGVTLAASNSLAVTARDSAGNVSVAKTVSVLADVKAPTDDMSVMRVNVSYVDQNGKTLAPSVGLSGKVGDSYKTMHADIVGYELAGNTGAVTGTMSTAVTNVTYQYKPVAANDTTDKVAPKAPTITEFATGNKNVIGTAEPFAKVTVKFPNGRTVSQTASQTGGFYVEVPSDIVLKAGDKLSVTAADAAGNVSSAATSTVVDKTKVPDTEAPVKPVVNDLVVGSKAVTGSAEAGTTVTVRFPNGVTAKDVAKALDVKTAATGPIGNFSVAIPSGVALKAGDALVVTSTDAAGNVSTESVTRVQTAAVTPPVVTPPVTPPVASPDTGTVTPTPDAPVADTKAPMTPVLDKGFKDGNVLTGKAEPGSEVGILFPNDAFVTTTAASDGSFSIASPKDLVFKVGDVIIVSSRDAAGNISEPDFHEIYATDENGNVIDLAPGTPITDDTDTDVTGWGKNPATQTPPVVTPTQTPTQAQTASPVRTGDAQTVDPDRELKAIPQASAGTNWWVVVAGLLSLGGAGFLVTRRRPKPTNE